MIPEVSLGGPILLIEDNLSEYQYLIPQFEYEIVKTKNTFPWEEENNMLDNLAQCNSTLLHSNLNGQKCILY